MYVYIVWYKESPMKEYALEAIYGSPEGAMKRSMGFAEDAIADYLKEVGSALTPDEAIRWNSGMEIRFSKDSPWETWYAEDYDIPSFVSAWKLEY